MTLSEHVQQLLDERERWLLPPPADMPEFARSLYTGEMMTRRIAAAEAVTRELMEAYALLHEALG